jgi:predicted nucleotidyltransferase
VFHPLSKCEEEEIYENCGERVYRGRGTVRLWAILSDVCESLFLPAIYRVEGVEVLDGDPAAT